SLTYTTLFRSPAGLLPAVEAMARRHKGQLARQVAQRRRRQAFNRRFAFVARALLRGDQQMALRLVGIFEWIALRDLDGFAGQAVEAREVTAHDLGGSELNGIFGIAIASTGHARAPAERCTFVLSPVFRRDVVCCVELRPRH